MIPKAMEHNRYREKEEGEYSYHCYSDCPQCINEAWGKWLLGDEVKSEWVVFHQYEPFMKVALCSFVIPFEDFEALKDMAGGSQ